jgi:murein DD-endopeptidase MepM/ murein hydrolase activator NlpD
VKGFVQSLRRGRRLAKYRANWTFAVALVLCFFANTSASAATWSVQTEPAKLVNGGPFLLRVHIPMKASSLKGTWLGHSVEFSYDAQSHTWFALAGSSFETAPGNYPLELTAERASDAPADKTVSFRKQLAVGPGKYPKVRVPLGVPGKFTEPSPEQTKQIELDQKTKQDYLNRVTPDREWSGPFAPPADAPHSDVFGSQRIFNGKAQREHQGLDYRVPTGTPVAAMNAGTVLLARFLYFEGNCIFLDHGQGLLTVYFHLSELKVKEGDTVKRGLIMGLSGGTGRATGPHLHVGVRWQGTYLDPARLLQLALP